MLKKIGDKDLSQAHTTAKEASFPAPFSAGLEYSSPARGTWNIVHTGMLIPESHQIFVCALGCLRGVVLTAAECNCLDRYSSITIREENVLQGNMEELMIEGVEDVLRKLAKRPKPMPKAILLFISCQHFFLAYDQGYVFSELRARHPELTFIDCYMIPTLRKSGMTPDQKMRIQMHSAWKPMEQDPKKVNLIGSNLALYQDSELRTWLASEGITLRQIHDCTTFEEYMNMAQASLNLYYEPLVRLGAEDLEKRLGQKNLYMPFTFNDEELEGAYSALAAMLRIEEPDFSALRDGAARAAAHAKHLIGDTPISVDYTFTFRIWSLTRMLLEQGFNVQHVYGDVFLPEEQADFEWVQDHYPDLQISATNRPEMRFMNPGPGTMRNPEESAPPAPGTMRIPEESAQPVLPEKNPQGFSLALGQKAAFFEGTDHFVNVAESGGYYGYMGRIELFRLMEEAYLEPKDRKDLIQRKGYGCESCL